jgi:hypothetical protein
VTPNEADLSQSSTPSLAYRRRDPRDRSKQLLEFGVMPSSKVPCLSLPQG